MILVPALHPAKKATAAGRINNPLITSIEAYPQKPVKEEKPTINVEDAAVIKLEPHKGLRPGVRHVCRNR
jgi:hypothetical protein